MQASEKELRAMLDFLEDATEEDRIELAKQCVAPRLSINDDEYALQVFNEALKPYLEEQLKTELMMLQMS